MPDAALERYNAARQAVHDNTPAALDNETSDAFAALPLWRRVQIMLTPAWRDAVLEIQVAAGHASITRAVRAQRRRATGRAAVPS